MSIQDRIKALRNVMQANSLAAYIISGTDPHQSEYVAACWQTRQFISGFTGSAGIVVVTTDAAGLWTDSRYHIQAEKELAGSGIELFKVGLPEVPDHKKWLGQTLAGKERVGIFGLEISVGEYRSLEKAMSAEGIEVVLTDDLLNEIWKERPAMPAGKVVRHAEQFSGLGRKEKIAKVRSEMAKKGARQYLIASLDDIAWLLNLRGDDVEFNPVFYAYLLMGIHECHLFVQREKLSTELKAKLSHDGIDLHSYGKLCEKLRTIGDDSTLYLSPDRIGATLKNTIPRGCRLMEGEDITTTLKACKNETEIEGIRNAMVKDGIALTKFLYWFENHPDIQGLSEWDVASKILACRAEQPDFRGESFSTGASFRDHSAVVHYHPTPKSALSIEGRGLLLSDSGGQYLDGTTDITRVFCVGEPTQGEKRDFTLVLKGHIALATVRFPKGTTGTQLDVLARKPLWDQGLNYGHGTGHGVGCYLNVHEGPQRISPLPNKIALAPGMVLSNEPGLYRDGEYGIRIENLILVIDDGQGHCGPFLRFETLTLFPIELDLVDPGLLNYHEIRWLNAYHKKVFDCLGPHLDKKEKTFLARKTRSID
jgi:Xaa-Pro aminopeptidase